MLAVLRPGPRPRFRRGPVSSETSQPSRSALFSAGRAWSAWVGAGSSSWFARPAIALRARGVRRGGMATAWFAMRQGTCRDRPAPPPGGGSRGNGPRYCRIPGDGGWTRCGPRISGSVRLRQDAWPASDRRIRRGRAKGVVTAGPAQRGSLAAGRRSVLGLGSGGAEPGLVIGARADVRPSPRAWPARARFDLADRDGRTSRSAHRGPSARLS